MPCGVKSLVAPWSLELKNLGILSVAEEEGERNEAAWAAGEAGHTPEDSFSSVSPAEPRLASSHKS